MPSLEVKNVSFNYPTTTNTLTDVSFEINAGEAVAVVGQNGAGKTTLAKLLNALLAPVSGEVLVNGIDTKTTTTAKLASQIAYAFQNPDDQIFHDVVYDEIAFGPKNLKLSEADVKANTKSAILLTKLEDYINDHPYCVSYSLRKFISIASTIAMDSDIIILDEPSAGQDQNGLAIIGDIVSELKRKGKIVIVITHDMDLVYKNFDRSIVMCQGSKIYDGETKKLFKQEDILQKANLELPQLLVEAKNYGVTKEINNYEELIMEIKNATN